MSVLNVTPGALKQGKILDQGYYPCQISGFEKKSSKDGQSTTFFLSFLVIAGPDAGAKLRWWVNEKGLDESIGAPAAQEVRELAASLGVKIDENAGFSIDFEGTVGQKLDVFSKPDVDGRDNTKRMNRVCGFRPFSA